MTTGGGWAMNRGDRVWHFYTGFGAAACGRPDSQRPTLGRVKAPDCAACADATWPASEMRTPRPR